MPLRRTIALTGDHEIPGIPFFEYEDESQHHWVARLQDVEIWFYGNVEAPEPERIPIALRVIPFLEAIEVRARVDLDNLFNRGTGPLDEWALLTVCFGFLGTEPFDEFSFHFGLGIWDWSTPYLVLYRLNTEDPVKSTLVGYSREDWLRSQLR